MIITINMMLLCVSLLVAALFLPAFLAGAVSSGNEAGYGTDRLIHSNYAGSNLSNNKRQMRLDPLWEVAV